MDGEVGDKRIEFDLENVEKSRARDCPAFFSGSGLYFLKKKVVIDLCLFRLYVIIFLVLISFW